MKNIDLKGIKIPLMDYASQGNAILGIRDSGKSYTATFMAEQLLQAGIPFVAFDPIGIWRYLKVPRPDGPGCGYKIVVAGDDGDLPLTPESAPEIVRAAMKENIPLVIDLYSMKLSKNDWKKIVEQSIRLLLYENKTCGLRHIFIEEASEFIPQRVGPEQGRVYAECEKLARMGGNASLGYTLINQRAEEVNKAVLELCDCLFLHRQKGRNSLTALGKWLDFADPDKSKEIIKSLPLLEQGHCWVWLPGSDAPRQVKIPSKNSFHPDRRNPEKIKSSLAINVDDFVGKLKGSLGKHIQAVQDNDPERLKREVRQLRLDVAKLEKEKTPPAVPVITEQRVRQIRTTLDQMTKNFEYLSKNMSQLYELIGSSPIAPWTKNFTPPTEFKGIVKIPLPRPGPIPSGLKLAPTTGDITSNKSPTNGLFPKAERRILTALAQYPEGRSKAQVAVLTGYAVSGGGFGNAIASLRTQGLIERNMDDMKITDIGQEALGLFEPLPTGEALFEYWQGHLAKAERRILEFLYRNYPQSHSKQEIAEAAGYEVNGGGFGNAISRLRTLELIEGRNELKASDHFFEK